MTYEEAERVADLLDPKPPTLREKVARAWCAEVYGDSSGSALNPSDDQLDAADVVLAVIAEDLREPGNEVMPNLNGLSPQAIYIKAYGESRAACVRRLKATP